jgi:two-component system NtrC family sensor kinase
MGNGFPTASHELRDAQSRLVQTERMAAIVNLVAGIAHEINTPVGAIHSSHDTFVRATRRLQEAIDEDQPELAQQKGRALRVIGEANRVITTGTERVTEIVRSLRNFARLDEAEMQRADIHEGLDSTLTLVHHKLKGRIEVVKAYGKIPEIVCFPSRLNQVFLNILTNAAQAISEEGTIRIRTDVDGPNAVVEISDTGRGIDETNLHHIFESGFTTKPTGEGTGLGLAISKQIVEDHGGELSAKSVVGEGTTFQIRLPLEGKTEP